MQLDWAVRGRVDAASIVGTGLLCAAIFWSTLAIGGVPSWAVLGLVALCLASATMNIITGQFRFDAGVLMLLGLAGYTLLQSTFVPLAWLGALDSEIQHTWQRTGQLVGDLHWATLSLEPFTTRLEALKLLAYACVWGGVSARAKELDPLAPARWVVWLSVTVFLLVAAHWVMGLSYVYGLYAPMAGGDRAWVGPLLNPNNLASLCNLGCFSALACGWRRGRLPMSRLVYALFAACLAAMCVLTGSRGGVVAVVLGAGYLGLSSVKRLRELPAWRMIAAGLLPLGLAVAFLLLAVTERTKFLLADTSLSKFELFDFAIQVLRVHPWWGIGRGAYGAEAGTVNGVPQGAVFTYIENFPLEWLVGSGVFVGGLALSGVAFGLYRPRGGFRTKALRTAVLVVVLQGMIDLGLELPGVAVPWLVVLAALWGGSVRGTWALPLQSRAFAFLPLVALGLAWFTLPAGDVARVDRARAAAAMSRAGAAPELDALLRQHPADPFLLRLGAIRAAKRNDPDVLAWLNTALQRSPADARTQLVLAEVLQRRGFTGQALVSLRAAAVDPQLCPEVVERVRAWAPERQMSVVPDGSAGVALLRQMALSAKAVGERRSLLSEAKQRAPLDWRVTSELAEAELLLAAGKVAEGAPNSDPAFQACSGAHKAECLQRVDEWLSELEGVPGANAKLRMLRAQVQLVSNNPRAAFEQLLAGCQRRRAEAGCLSLLLQAGRLLGGEAFTRAATVYLDGMCSGAYPCSNERIAIAREFEAHNDLAAAMQLYIAATSEPEGFLGASRVAHQLGRDREALHWLNKGERAFSQDESVLQRIREQRRALGLLPSPSGVNHEFTQ